jgi:iron(III) transport system permease protein
MNGLARLFTPRIALALLALLAFGYPLSRLMLVPLFPALAPLPVASAGGEPPSLAAIATSARIGVEAALAAVIPGFAAAYVLERYEWHGGRVLAGCMWLLVLTPSYLLSAGWQLLVAMPVLAATPAYDLLFSEAGIVALLALKGLPLACFVGRSCWAAVGGEIDAALRVHIRSPYRRAMIQARLMAPMAGAVIAVVFIEGITDFGIAAVLGARLHLPLAIHGVYAALARVPVDFERAAMLGFTLIAMSAGAVMLHQWLSARLGGQHMSRPLPRRRPDPLPAAAAWFGVAAIILLAFGAPALALVIRATGVTDGTLEPVRLGADHWLTLFHSLCYAFVTATISTALALVLLGAGRPVGARRVLDAAMLASMAVPGVVLGAAYVIAFNGWLPLYGTPILLMLGLVTTHVPLLARFLQGPVALVPASLAEAGAVHGLRGRDRTELIHAPLLMRPLLWGWSIAFGGVFFELPMSSLLHPTGRAPVGVTLLLLDETRRFTAEAQLALAGIAICLIVVGLVVGVLPRWLERPAGDDAAVPA